MEMYSGWSAVCHQAPAWCLVSTAAPRRHTPLQCLAGGLTHAQVHVQDRPVTASSGDTGQAHGVRQAVCSCLASAVPASISNTARHNAGEAGEANNPCCCCCCCSSTPCRSGCSPRGTSCPHCHLQKARKFSSPGGTELPPPGLAACACLLIALLMLMLLPLLQPAELQQTLKVCNNECKGPRQKLGMCLGMVRNS